VRRGWEGEEGRWGVGIEVQCGSGSLQIEGWIFAVAFGFSGVIYNGT
jgi:hypothetical protein